LKNLIPITIIAIILCVHKFDAQILNHDVGLFIGSTNLQSDYGNTKEYSSHFTNNGTSLSLSHYLSFNENTSRWGVRNRILDHLKLKTEIKYLSNGTFSHRGYYAEKKSIEGEKIRAMKGSLKMLDVGLNLECFLKPLSDRNDYSYNMYLNPFFTFGFKYSFYTNGITSELGDWNKDRTLLPTWYSEENTLDIGAGEALSVCSGIGIVGRISSNIDFVTQVSYQYFFSDSIDGLNPNKVDGTNSNEYSVNIEFGIIYQLNFY